MSLSNISDPNSIPGWSNFYVNSLSAKTLNGKPQVAIAVANIDNGVNLYTDTSNRFGSGANPDPITTFASLNVQFSQLFNYGNTLALNVAGDVPNKTYTITGFLPKKLYKIKFVLYFLNQTTAATSLTLSIPTGINNGTTTVPIFLQFASITTAPATMAANAPKIATYESDFFVPSGFTDAIFYLNAAPSATNGGNYISIAVGDGLVTSADPILNADFCALFIEQLN